MYGLVVDCRVRRFACFIRIDDTIKLLPIARCFDYIGSDQNKRETG